MLSYISRVTHQCWLMCRFPLLSPLFIGLILVNEFNLLQLYQLHSVQNLSLPLVLLNLSLVTPL